MTRREARVLQVTTEALEAGRGSVTASFVAARLDVSTRVASGLLSSLARKGELVALANGFVGRTFYVLPGR